MPTYDHQCTNPECMNIWEDFYSITDDPPTHCPKCNSINVKRLIGIGTAGIVELTGNELDAKNKADIRQLKSDMRRDENVYHNLMGERK